MEQIDLTENYSHVVVLLLIVFLLMLFYDYILMGIVVGINCLWGWMGMQVDFFFTYACMDLWIYCVFAEEIDLKECRISYFNCVCVVGELLILKREL